MNISKDVSSSLMIANLMAMLLVVTIHYNSKGSIDTSFGYDLNYIIQESLTNGFARSAVPIFARPCKYFCVTA
jgi:surface polysaccharide O-acyltransferase-like enzyme